MKLKCLVVDDEPIAQEILVNFIEQLDFLELIKTANNALEALKILHEKSTDLMFLDIKMPVLNGLDMLKSLEHPPVIILTTAFSEYALESYEFGVKDYLLKPIAFERFLKAVNKVANEKELQIPNQTEETNHEQKFMFFKADKKFFKFYFEEILFFEGCGNYVKVHTSSHTPIMVLDKLSNLETKLIRYDFVRTHKSFLINLEHVKEIYGNRIIIQENEVPIGASYKEEFLQKVVKD